MQDILIGIGPRLRWSAKVRVVPKDGDERNVQNIVPLPDGLYKLRREGLKFLYVRTVPFFTIERMGNRKPGVKTINLHYLEEAYRDEKMQ